MPVGRCCGWVITMNIHKVRTFSIRVITGLNNFFGRTSTTHIPTATFFTQTIIIIKKDTLITLHTNSLIWSPLVHLQSGENHLIVCNWQTVHCDFFGFESVWSRSESSDNYQNKYEFQWFVFFICMNFSSGPYRFKIYFDVIVFIRLNQLWEFQMISAIKKDTENQNNTAEKNAMRVKRLKRTFRAFWFLFHWKCFDEITWFLIFGYSLWREKWANHFFIICEKPFVRLWFLMKMCVLFYGNEWREREREMITF